jgi:hypothetical protein
MKPATHDFDVITDAPAPVRRPPQPAEQPPQADAEEEARRGAPLEETEHVKIQAAS